MSVGRSVVLSVGKQWATDDEGVLSQAEQAHLARELGAWSSERVRLLWFRRTEESRQARIQSARYWTEEVYTNSGVGRREKESGGQSGW